jgi:hypothetical protein
MIETTAVLQLNEGWLFHLEEGLATSQVTSRILRYGLDSKRIIEDGGSDMEKEFVIQNPLGIHSRPAGEETASTAQSLAGLAEELNHSVGFFKIN